MKTSQTFRMRSKNLSSNVLISTVQFRIIQKPRYFNTEVYYFIFTEHSEVNRCYDIFPIFNLHFQMWHSLPWYHTRHMGPCKPSSIQGSIPHSKGSILRISWNNTGKILFWCVTHSGHLKKLIISFPWFYFFIVMTVVVVPYLLLLLLFLLYFYTFS